LGNPAHAVKNRRVARVILINRRGQASFVASIAITSIAKANAGKVWNKSKIKDL
jgi:hypothetical protein